MRPGNIRAFLAGMVVGAAVTTGTVIVAAPARADDARAWAAEYGPVVCDAIGLHPTMAGLMTVLEDVQSSGYTAAQSGELVAESVFDVCPQYIPLLRQFVAVFGPKRVA